jgi:hypothetical protein
VTPSPTKPSAPRTGDAIIREAWVFMEATFGDCRASSDKAEWHSKFGLLISFLMSRSTVDAETAKDGDLRVYDGDYIRRDGDGFIHARTGKRLVVECQPAVDEAVEKLVDVFKRMDEIRKVAFRYRQDGAEVPEELKREYDELTLRTMIQDCIQPL